MTVSKLGQKLILAAKEGRNQMTEFSEHVEEYIRQDRQWRREQRIAHAKMRLAKEVACGFPSEVTNFWRAVLQRIDHDEQDRFWRTKP